MDIGYARVSTDDQNLNLQLQALEAAGCERIYRDRGVSGARVERPGLADAIRRAKSGDVLVVWKLDRLGRPRKLSPRQIARAREKIAAGAATCASMAARFKVNAMTLRRALKATN